MWQIISGLSLCAKRGCIYLQQYIYPHCNSPLARLYSAWSTAGRAGISGGENCEIPFLAWRYTCAKIIFVVLYLFSEEFTGLGGISVDERNREKIEVSSFDKWVVYPVERKSTE